MTIRQWVAGAGCTAVLLSTTGCGYDLSPRLLQGEGFTVQMPGAWLRYDRVIPESGGVREIYYLGGHGDSQFTISVRQHPSTVRLPDVLDAHFDTGFDEGFAPCTQDGHACVDARLPYLDGDVEDSITEFVRVFVVGSTEYRVTNRLLGDDLAQSDGRWAAFRDSFDILAG